MSTGLQLAGKAATMAAGLVLFSLLTRFLGVDGFGRYTFVLAYISFFAVLTDMGSQAIAVREMARHRDRAEAVAGQFFTLRAATSLLAACIAIAIAAAVPGDSFRGPGVLAGILISALALLAGPLGGTTGAIFQMALRMQIPVVTDVASRLAVLIGVVILVAAGAGAGAAGARLDDVLALTAVVGVVAALAALWGSRRILRFRPVLYDRTLLLPMVRDAAPLAIILVIGIIHYRIDVFILSAMKGSHAVGLYGVSTKLLDVGLAISGMFISVAFPVLSRRADSDPTLLQRAFEKSLDFMLMLGIGIAVFAAVLAPTAVRVVGGPGYSAAAVPLAVIAWAVPIMFVSQVFSHMVVVANRQMCAVPAVLLAVLANVLLNVLLIPTLGVVAPALVTDLTETITLIGMAVITFRHFGFWPSVPSALRVFVPALLAAAAGFASSPLGPLPVAVIAGGLYCGGLVASGALRREDVVSLFAAHERE